MFIDVETKQKIEKLVLKEIKITRNVMRKSPIHNANSNIL